MKKATGNTPANQNQNSNNGKYQPLEPGIAGGKQSYTPEVVIMLPRKKKVSKKSKSTLNNVNITVTIPMNIKITK